MMIVHKLDILCMILPSLCIDTTLTKELCICSVRLWRAHAEAVRAYVRAWGSSRNPMRELGVTMSHGAVTTCGGVCFVLSQPVDCVGVGFDPARAIAHPEQDSLNFEYTLSPTQHSPRFSPI